METIRNTSQYYLTEDGDMTLGHFCHPSAPSVRILTAISRGKQNGSRNEVAIVADYYKKYRWRIFRPLRSQKKKRRSIRPHHQRPRQRAGHRHKKPLGQTLPGKSELSLWGTLLTEPESVKTPGSCRKAFAWCFYSCIHPRYFSIFSYPFPLQGGRICASPSSSGR